jgi:hypothetical protein
MEKPPRSEKTTGFDDRFESAMKETISGLSNLKPGINFLRGKPFIFELVPTNKSDLVNEECPARFRMIPTNDPMAHYEGIYEVCLVGVWEGVPEKYKPLLIAHELREKDIGSHKKALEYEMEIARRMLNKQEFEEYKKWRERYNKKI